MAIPLDRHQPESVMRRSTTKASRNSRNPGHAAVRRWLRVEELEPRILLSGSTVGRPPSLAEVAHVRPAAPPHHKASTGPHVLQTPGVSGQTVRAEFTATFSSTQFRDEAGASAPAASRWSVLQRISAGPAT